MEALGPAPVPTAKELHALVESNQSFVVRIAHEYRHRGLPFEDLLNEGNVGLLQAARRFNPDRGVKFITYAVWWIRKTILKAISEHGRLVRIPEYQAKRYREVRDAENLLLRDLAQGIDVAELPKKLIREIAALRRGRQVHQREVRLDDTLGGDGSLPIGGTLRDGLPSPEEAYLKAEALRLIGVAIGCLTTRERSVLALRYGFGSDQGMSLQETGRALGISGERVRQIEAGALARMRRSVIPARRSQAPLRRSRAAIPL